MSWLILILGLALAAIGATTAVAVVAASRLELTRWAARKLAGADTAVTLLARPGDIYSVANGLVAVGVSMAGVAAPWALQYIGVVPTLALELGVGLPLIALLVYFFPRAIGRRWPEPIVKGLVPRFAFLSRIVGRVVRGRAETERAELAAILKGGGDGIAREDELEIVSGVMAFAERTVREVMTPRTRIVAAKEDATPAELVRVVSNAGYTRIPLQRRSLDEIVGMVHAFDLLKAGPAGPVKVRPVAVLPSTRRCADALLDLKRERRHLAVVLDEFGGTAGIVTMEDLLEELVGEIFDELDERAPAPQHAPNVLVAEASTPLSKICDHFQVRLEPPPRIETAGGYLSWAAGRILQPGERMVAGGLEWDVVEGTAARIARLVIRRAPATGRGPA